jgi:hypothetical protein
LPPRAEPQILEAPEEGYEVSHEERSQLEHFAAEMAYASYVVNTMTGVKRGIVLRHFERETKRLEKERYGDD